MATEKYFVFSESGELKRMKGRIVRFLDNEDPTGSDKDAIRTSLEVSPDAAGLVQADVGTAPNEIPVNGMLGDMAYQSSDGVSAGTVSADEIGVGTSAPNYEIEVKASNARIAATSDGGVVNHLQSNSTTGFVGTHTNHPLALKTNGSERVRIDSSGNVKLSGDETELQFNSDTGVGNNVRARIQCEGQTGTYGYGGDLVFKTTADNNTSAERLRITSSALVMGSGMAIDFGSVAGGTGTPATDAGLLNDFERGSFTPSFTSTGTAPTLTYLAQVGTYTKVGNLVTCHGRVRVNAVTGAGTGSLQITGLPFATQNVSNLGSGGSVCLAAFFGTSSSGCPTHISGGNNATVMTLKTLKNSAGVVASLDNTDAADLAGNCYVDFSVTYTTA
jgi:hypothetical protein